MEQSALVRHLRLIARRHEIALASSVLIGESWASVQAALASGCQPVFAMTGRGRDELAQPQLVTVCAATGFAADLVTAALGIEATCVKAVGQPVA